MGPQWEHQEEPDLELEKTAASGNKEREILGSEKIHEKLIQEIVQKQRESPWQKYQSHSYLIPHRKKNQAVS